ncbi:hypothetical protein [Flavobacterium sp. YO64]|nr:hypothetical protein [Flavobacterium sp. YO64]
MANVELTDKEVIAQKIAERKVETRKQKAKKIMLKMNLKTTKRVST